MAQNFVKDEMNMGATDSEAKQFWPWLFQQSEGTSNFGYKNDCFLEESSNGQSPLINS